MKEHMVTSKKRIWFVSCEETEKVNDYNQCSITLNIIVSDIPYFIQRNVSRVPAEESCLQIQN